MAKKRPGCPDIVARGPADAAEGSLADLVADPAPWLHITGTSEQVPPLYLGATPREMVLGLPAKDRPELPVRLKEMAEKHAARIRRNLAQGNVELEAWPVQNWRGQWTWAFARWRKADGEWRWLSSRLLRKTDDETQPELPDELRTWVNADAGTLFTDFLELEDLYSKPRFGDCVWTDEVGATIVAAWLPPDDRDEWRERLTASRHVAHAISQPARFNGRAHAFVLPVSTAGVEWGSQVKWVPNPEPVATAVDGETQIGKWPTDYDARYEKDVRRIAGESPVVFPVSGRRAQFLRKSSAQPDHDLETMVDYLEERYQKLGLQTRRQRFVWRGIPQSNLIAVIPGSLPREKNRPVLLMDHMDTAFCEDKFDQTGERVPTMGADDNSTAVALLLAAAERLKDSRPLHDIWLVHVTGEEFPADGTGTRHFMGRLLEEGRDITGLLVTDMIGWRRKDDRVFQIAAGLSPASVKLAEVALGAAAVHAPQLAATFRHRFDERSYLYNTDGIFFSDMGFPVILFNEHLNAINMRHPHYHQTTDVPGNVDFGYAATISRVVIETALRLARKAP